MWFVLLEIGENTAIEFVRVDESMPLQKPNIDHNEPAPASLSRLGIHSSVLLDLMKIGFHPFSALLHA